MSDVPELWASLLDRLRENEDAVIVLSGERGITGGELARLARERGALLGAAAGAQRRRVVLCGAEPLDVLLDILGCWSAGLIPVPMRERSPTLLVEALASAVGAAAVVHEGNLVRHNQAPREAPSAREALLLTTSGTSGVPKLVALPAASVRLNFETIGRELAMTTGDRVLVAQPLSHVYGLIGSCLMAMAVGAQAHIFDSRTPSSILQGHIRNNGITVVQGAPTFWRLFLGYWRGAPFPTVRLWTTASEAPGRTLIDRVGAALPEARGLLGFGMTEAGPRVSHVDVADSAVDDGCVGKPFAHIDWRVDAGATGTTVGPLALRGPSMFLGYLPTSVPGGPIEERYFGYDDDGWFVTSDLVAVDAQGRLLYRGRADTKVKVGDHLVNPMVVEQELLRCAGVLNARCTAESHAMLGHILVAELVAAPGHEIDIDSVRRSCAARLEPWLVPRTVRVVAELPTTGGGKRVR